MRVGFLSKRRKDKEWRFGKDLVEPTSNFLRRAKHKYLIKKACGNCGNPYGNILGGGGGGLLKHGYELLCGNSA